MARRDRTSARPGHASGLPDPGNRRIFRDQEVNAMSTRRLVLAAACAALALPAPEASAINVTAVSIEASPSSSTGPCPASFRFHAKVALNKEGRFTYRWERSDGAADTAAPRTGVYDGTHATTLSYDWGPFAHSVAGWVTVHVLGPESRSATARFTLTCPPPPPTIVPGAIGRPALPAGAQPSFGPVFTPSPLLLPPVQVPSAFKGVDGKTMPAGLYAFELRQGTQGILIGLLRNGQKVAEVPGKFVGGQATVRMQDFHFDVSSKVSFGGGGGAGKVSCSNNLHPGAILPYIEFTLPAAQK